ncbi:MAG TPA: acyl-CoA synthetase FdrA [Anaerolineales bacterium]|nr:acyl-CoA synthetase FdrA [Anaerolineales bacterium]
MATAQRMVKNLYRDSVSLMQFSEKLCALDGIQQASAVMATENNISLLVEAGLLEQTVSPSPNDLLIVVEGGQDSSLSSALDQAEAMLKQKSAEAGEGGVRRVPPRSLEMGLESMPSANFVLISTPGEYAAAEARKALQLGLHVMMFSDNVSIEEEIRLKQYAHEHDLLVMGPDCGTAIINGIPLGFANVVRRGDIGVVAASGTGLQQVTSLIDRFGGGITQAIGTGGHDLKSEVGGITMLQGIAALAADPATKVILLVSKPPSADVMKNVLEKAAQSGKPVVVEFIGADPASITGGNIIAVKTLEDAAAASVNLSKGKAVKKFSSSLPARYNSLVKPAQNKLKKGQKYIRGLFSGGTFCYETVLLLSEALGKVYSNTPIKKDEKIPNVWQSLEHTVIDLGDDLFTQGRPHPMMDFRLRNERIVQEAADPETAVILLDIVLGYGSNMDPAAELIPAIQEAHRIAAQAKRRVIFVGSVCGTQGDPQNLSRQEAMLREVGVILADSNAQAARFAAAIVS